MQALDTAISDNADLEEKRFRALFDRCDDAVFRSIDPSGGIKGFIVLMDGMVDYLKIEVELLQTLLSSSRFDGGKMAIDLAKFLNGLLPVKCKLQTQVGQATEALLGGSLLLFADGMQGCLQIDVSDLQARSIEEPASEPVIRGSRDGFTESLRTNKTLLRRKLKTPDLKSESCLVGDLSRTKVSLLYVEGIAQQKLVDEVRTRIGRIRLKTVLESGSIEELIMDNRRSIFPQLMATERPDRAAASLAEGRVVILVDNTPFALVAPATIFEMLQAAEDYNQHYMVAAATRWLRYWLTFSALVFPSLYVAVVTMHQEMLPTSLLLSIAASREGVPFPAIVEAFIMELAFEGLREAGIRLPRPVGQAVSIVGALVIGQAAVQAGLVSASLVIVVSFTGIASFVFPSYSLGLSVRLLRFPLMILAGTMGLFGVLLGIIALLVHMSKLRSFGVPYLSPLAPVHSEGLKDILARVPWWKRQQG